MNWIIHKSDDWGNINLVIMKYPDLGGFLKWQTLESSNLLTTLDVYLVCSVHPVFPPYQKI